MSGDNTFEVTDDFIEDTFDKLLKIIWENDVELSKEKPKTVMGHQLYVREGPEKTSFLNFVDVCKTMHRHPDHVMAFLLAELGASGTLHKQRRLFVDGRFPAEDFEEILRRYSVFLITRFPAEDFEEILASSWIHVWCRAISCSCPAKEPEQQHGRPQSE